MSDLIYITTCLLCGQKFTAKPLEEFVVGQQPAEKTAKFFAGLMEHLTSRAQHEMQVNRKRQKRQEPPDPMPHAQLLGTIQAHGMQYQGFVALTGFDTQDPEIAKGKEVVRMQTAQMVRGFSLSDDDLLDGLVKINLDADVQGLVLQLLKGIRDGYEGRMPQRNQAETLIHQA